MRTKVLQTNFTGGEISETLAGRTELEKYYKSCSVAENVVIMPHGGLKRRPGMSRVAGSYINKYCRLESFEFSVTQRYLIVVATDLIHIYKDGTQVATVTSPFTTTAMVDSFDMVQSADTMIFVQEDLQPKKLVRGVSDSSWTIEDIVFTNIPTFKFNPNYTNKGISTTVTVKIGDVVFNNDGNAVAGANLTYYKSIFNKTIDLATEDYSITAQWQNLTTTGLEPVWSKIHKYKNTGVPTIVDITIGDIVYNLDGNSIQGISGHYYKAKVAASSSDLAFTDYSNTTNWSDLGVDANIRGWPRTCTFHGGRLWFGGSKSRISTAWGSVVNDFFNFNVGTGLADEALFDTLDTDQYNAIQGIYSGRNLQIFTSGGEFYNPSKVITPADSSWLMQTNYGAKRIRPVSVDGSTLYVSRNGRALRQFLYNFNEDAFVSVNALLMSEHLVTDIKTVDVQKGTLDNISDFVYMIDANGDCLVLNTMRSEDILGWTHWTTQGLFKDCAVVGDDVYFLVMRDSTYYIEKLNTATYTDHNTTKAGTAFTTVATLEESPMKLKVHRVVSDGSVQLDKTPDGSGVITLDRPADYCEVGLGYDVTVTTMPINFQDREGMTVNSKKRVLKTKLRVYNTKGAIVEGELLQGRKFPIQFNSNPDPYTGVLEISHLGFSEINTVTVSQSDPLPFHLIQLESETEA